MTAALPGWRILLQMDVNPDLTEEFEQVWTVVGASVSADPANLGQWLMRDAQQSNLYYIVSDWTSREEFERFERSDRHVEHRQKLHPYRRSGSMQSMTIVAHLPGTHERDD